MRSLAKIYSVRSIARDCEVLLSSQPRSRKQLFRKGVAQLRYSGIPKTLRSRGATSSKNRFLAYTFCHPGRSAAKIRDPVHRSASAAGKGSRLLDPCLRRDDKAGLEAGIAIATTFLQIIQDCCAPIQHPEINSRSWRDLFQNRFLGHSFCHPGLSAAKIRDPVFRGLSVWAAQAVRSAWPSFETDLPVLLRMREPDICPDQAPQSHTTSS